MRRREEVASRWPVMGTVAQTPCFGTELVCEWGRESEHSARQVYKRDIKGVIAVVNIMRLCSAVAISR
jgi:hypothetical protein